MEQNKIGKLIQNLRREKKLTQQELADKLGVSPKTISKWETGNGLPDISLLKKVSEIFNITILLFFLALSPIGWYLQKLNRT